MSAPFRTRFPVTEITRIGPQIEGAVKKHASEEKDLLRICREMAAISSQIAALARPGLSSLLDLDFARDELIRALGSGIEHFTHRVDLPDKRAAAERLEDALLPDGYSWVTGAYGAQTKRVGELLTDAAKPEAAADLAAVGLDDCITAIDAAQKAFEMAEQNRGAGAAAGLEVTREARTLARKFNRKLDLYVAAVNDAYPPEDPCHESANTALLQPLVEASGRDRAADPRPAPGAPAAPGTPPATPTSG